MEPELLVCTPSYADWLNEVGNPNSSPDYNTIDELMEGVGSSTNQMDLPETMSPVVLISNGQTDNVVQTEVEVHPPPSSNNRGRGKGSRGGGGGEGEDVEDEVEMLEEVQGPPNRM